VRKGDPEHQAPLVYCRDAMATNLEANAPPAQAPTCREAAVLNAIYEQALSFIATASLPLG